MFAPFMHCVKLCFWFSSLVLACAVAAGAGSAGANANVQVGSQSSGCLVVRRADGHLVGHLAPVPLAVGAAQSVPRRRRLRVVLYARYSTVGQNHLSIDDQIAKCRHFVSVLGLGDVEFEVLQDLAVSGEPAPTGARVIKRVKTT